MDQMQEQAAKVRGYQLWQESGYTHGHDQEHWKQAEQEIEAAEHPAPALSAGCVESHMNVSLTPIAMVCAAAQGWIELSSAFAEMTTRLAWRV